jgi:aminopeptidase N
MKDKSYNSIRAFSAAFIVGALLFSFTGQTFSRPMRPWQSFSTFQVDKKPLPPVHYIRSRDFDTKHIALDLRFNWDTEQTIGTEEFTFSPLTPGFRELVLDAGLMVFESVTLKNGVALKYDYDESKSRLSISFSKPLDIADTVTVVIRYKTRGSEVPNTAVNGGGGLRFVKPTKQDPTKPTQIWSQGESEYNHFWFPSYDYPNDFRTTELTATVKKPLMVISNGSLVETKDNGDGTRTFHWKMDTPFANYLSSIVVGEYTEVKGSYLDVPVSTYTYSKWKYETESTAKRLPEMVKYFSEILNFKYPYPKYAQTIAREFGGGMENISATTQTDQMIIDSRTELDRDQDGLQSHELAHQWFGDYVTCRDWSDIWLNESFATYMQALWTLKSKGRDEFLWSDVKSNQDQYLNTWNQGQRRPIVTKYYASPDAVFDTYAYPRGGAVLHMLRKQLGDANFFRALNHYLRSNANEPVETADLRIAIEEATGQSMDAFFDQWLFRMGHPVFEVTKSYDAGAKTLKMTVRQTQKFDLTSGYPQVKYFQTPVDIEIVTSNGSREETVLIEPKEVNEFTFSNVESSPLLVDFDEEGTLIKELKFEKSMDELVYQLRKDDDVIGRRAALDLLTAKATEESTSKADREKILNELRTAVESDDFHRMRAQAIASLRTILVKPSPPGQTAANIDLDAATRGVLLRAIDDDSSDVRSAAISMLGTTGDKAYADKYARAIASDKSYTVIQNAANALARTGGTDAYAILRKLAQTDSWRDNLTVSGLNALALLGDKNALDLGYKFGDESNPPSQRKNAALGLIAAFGKGDPKAFELIFANFKQALETNDFQGIIGGIRSMTTLADPRGQEAFDLAKEKFKANQNLLGLIGQLESQFKKAIE